LNPYAPLAVGLMGIENLFRYTALAVGLKPSASQGEARLRGLDRIIDSKDHFSRSHRADRRNGRGGAIPSPSIISRRAGPDCTHTKIAAASAT
jgi:hypothetical protein